LKPYLGGVGSVAHSITVNEQSQSNWYCWFFSTLFCFRKNI